MNNLDKQMEELITRLNNAETANKELKANSFALRGALEFMMQRPYDEDGFINMVRQCNEILDLTPKQCVDSIKANAAIELAGIFHDGEHRIGKAMLICEEYANKLRNSNS